MQQMVIKTEVENPQIERTIKRVYVKPEIKEVWNENIGMTGVYLLEM
jgi:hypothetical protein